MRCSAMGLELIREMEGLRLSPYRVGRGKLTAGYGHELSDEEIRQKIPYDKQQAERWLKDDVMAVEECLEQTIELEIKSYQWDALVSFVYNIGRNAYRKSTICRYIKFGNWTKAAEEFEKWIYNNHEVLEGLIVRRNVEREMFEGKLQGLPIGKVKKKIQEIRKMVEENIEKKTEGLRDRTLPR